jgi:hypothetical protein
MRFRLIYDGLLSSSGGTSAHKDKWAIRRQLHPQLVDLWTSHTQLHDWYPAYTDPLIPGRKLSPTQQLAGEHPPIDGILPLVRNSIGLVCSLDILFLRQQERGSVITRSGDLDNRIKVLFDGLQMPQNEAERKGQDITDRPFHCLLENDALITSFAVRSDRLLARQEDKPSHAVLVIDVTVSHTKGSWAAMRFVGD